MNKKLSPIFSNDYDDLKRYNTTFNVNIRIKWDKPEKIIYIVIFRIMSFYKYLHRIFLLYHISLNDKKMWTFVNKYDLMVSGKEVDIMHFFSLNCILF